MILVNNLTVKLSTGKFFLRLNFQDYYLCDFVFRDIKITVYLESPRKINFNLVSEISQTTVFNY